MRQYTSWYEVPQEIREYITKRAKPINISFLSVTVDGDDWMILTKNAEWKRSINIVNAVPDPLNSEKYMIRNISTTITELADIGRMVEDSERGEVNHA